MLIVGIVIATLLCGVLTLSAYFNILFIEALRLRPHHAAKAFEYSDEHVLPLLGLTEHEGVRRYSMVRQTALVLLATDLTLLFAGDLSATETKAWVAALEALVFAFGAMLLFAHIVPNLLVTRTAGRWSKAFVPLVRVLAWVIHPFVLLTSFVASVAEISGDEAPDEAPANGLDDIGAFLDAGQEEGLIGAEDRKLIQSVVEFGDKTVREVMTARPNIAAISADATVEQLRRLVIEEEYSRVPVYEGDIDSIVGFVHSRDTLEIEEPRRAEMSARELLRPIGLAPETKPIHELVRELQESNSQMAIVIDEYGQTAGLVTMEDMIEEIVGEIRDESEPDRDVVEYPDASFVSSGNLDLDRLEELVGFRPAEDTESTTIGGLVCEHLGQVPSPGAKLELDGILIEVLSADERRVRSVRVRRPLRPASDQEADGGSSPRRQAS